MNEVYSKTVEIGTAAVDLSDNIRPSSLLQLL